ncbi:MAG: DUF86 domain-containing protein [Candidatus Altiarchaeales archaeon]|nr:DUF86 domain-containing protein [Candidatus Altiarchaeota archaeon]MCG2782026.1 DUF86 domain-containing protein [Candidatus Altiarchaeales archaeon]
MVSLSEKVNAEKENVDRVLADLETAMNKEEKSVIELAAIATFLHNIYNGVENILKQVLKEKGIIVPHSDTWHKELLDVSVSNNILPETLADKLREYLAFRHFFVHGYGFMIDAAPLEELARGIPSVWSEFLVDVEKVLQDK